MSDLGELPSEASTMIATRMSKETTFYVTGGTLRRDAASYVKANFVVDPVKRGQMFRRSRRERKE